MYTNFINWRIKQCCGIILFNFIRITNICSVLLIHFLLSYEDGQVGDTSINTQDPSIHREILRVIGNQTATGWTTPKAIPLPKPALLTQSWIFEYRRFYHRYFTNHRTQDRGKIFPIYKIKYRYHCVFKLANHTRNILPGLLIQYTFLKAVVSLSVQLTDCLFFKLRKKWLFFL